MTKKDIKEAVQIVLFFVLVMAILGTVGRLDREHEALQAAEQQQMEYHMR